MTYGNQIQIVLFDNTTRRKSDKAPDEVGTVEFPDGTKYDVAVWNRVSKSGNPFKSGVLKLPDPKYAPREGGGRGKSGGQASVDF